MSISLFKKEQAVKKSLSEQIVHGIALVVFVAVAFFRHQLQKIQKALLDLATEAVYDAAALRFCNIGAAKQTDKIRLFPESSFQHLQLIQHLTAAAFLPRQFK